MAAAVDRGALSPADAGAPRWRGLLLIAAVSTLALAGVVVLQVQQLQQLATALQTGHELRVVEMHRQETEYLQLREQWQLALNAAEPLDLRALSLRYEIWVGRVAMLRQSAFARHAAQSALPHFQQTLDQVDAFVKRADAVMDGDPLPAVRRAALAVLQPELQALGEPIHDLTLSAGHRATQELTERHLVLSRHTRVTVALTAVMGLLVLTFCGLSLRQMRLLARRQATLQSMATELEAARAAAESANQAKTRFLTDMSHEMRTPFQGLLSMLSMLRETPLEPRQLDYLRTASESADHLLSVLNDIVDLSQLEAGRMQVAPGPTDLHDMVGEVESLMRPIAMARQLDLHVAIDRHVPRHVRLDATRVKQVLYNLLSNAIKFSERGQVSLDVKALTPERAPATLQFCITDTGVGMGHAMLARLFQRFERAEAKATPGPTGNGLGLEISLGLARLMGGDLSVSSQPGLGSRFSFRVPLEALDVPPMPAVQAELTFAATPRLQVLVAEDHPINRQVLAALLDGMGHESHFVSDGQAAIDAVQHRRFDLVLMDLHMPTVDGIEATRQIRALGDRLAATVPIIALTADAFTDTRERCLVAGMNDFLSKPVSREKLGALLRQLFGSGAGVAPVPLRDPLQARPDVELPDTIRLLDTSAVERAREQLTPATYAATLGHFFGQGVETVEALRKAVRDAQPQDLRDQAHALRGAALNLGLGGLASTARLLEEGAAHLPAHEVARLVQRFANQLTATCDAAEQAGLLRPAADVTR
jgi:two-component system, sensor histidine kinase